MSLKKYDCFNPLLFSIPGKEGTDWEGGTYKVMMEFSEDFPSKVRKNSG